MDKIFFTGFLRINKNSGDLRNYGTGEKKLDMRTFFKITN